MAKKITYTIVNKYGDIELRTENTQKKKIKYRLLYIDIGFHLVIPLLLSIFAGNYLDNRFQQKPLFTIIFIFFGTMITFYNLYKIFKDVTSSSNN